MSEKASRVQISPPPPVGNFMKIESSEFKNNVKIPSKYTCDGENFNPPLKIFDVPENAKSLVLIVDDPDATMGIFTHWIIWNINPAIKQIAENNPPQAIEGKNDFGKIGYGGPCPSTGTHGYFFKLYALDILLSIPEDSDKKKLEAAMKNHILDSAELIGLYSRN